MNIHTETIDKLGNVEASVSKAKQMVDDLTRLFKKPEMTKEQFYSLEVEIPRIYNLLEIAFDYLHITETLVDDLVVFTEKQCEKSAKG